MCDTGGGSQYGEEQPMIPGILPEFFIDQVQTAFDQTDREGTDTANVRVLLQA